MKWDYHTFMAQPEWFLLEVIRAIKRQQDDARKHK
jgi:hypothetical protein